MKYILGMVIIVLVIWGSVSFLKKNVVHAPSDINSNQQSPNTNSQTQVSSGEVPSIPLQLPSNFVVHTFASDLGNPRDLVFSPGGTLLVSSPERNHVIALPDPNHRGNSQFQKVVINQGNHIHGLAFYKNQLFVAEVDKVVRYNWNEQNLEATFDKVLFSLPDNQNHINRTLTIDDAGTMYVSVGSTCNVCNEKHQFSATVLTSDINGTNPRIFARGLRNAPFTVINPQTKELWGTEMGRDQLGDDIPPDEINIIQQGKDYGWPNCYGNKITDTNFSSLEIDNCSSTETPVFEIPAHSAPLGLTFINSSQFPSDWQGDLLVAYHGSWNRSTPTGYKVVHMNVEGNTITNAEDFMTGFIEGRDAAGRPVDVIFDQQGNLYISDDKAGNVYIIQKPI